MIDADHQDVGPGYVVGDEQGGGGRCTGAPMTRTWMRKSRHRQAVITRGDEAPAGQAELSSSHCTEIKSGVIVKKIAPIISPRSMSAYFFSSSSGTA